MNYIMTKLTHDRKREEIQELRRKLESARQDLTDAKEQGDLSENPGYSLARKDVEKFSEQIEERTMELIGISIVDPLNWAEAEPDEGIPECAMGSLVTISRDGKEETYLIGGAGDEKEGVIPYNSPLGRALILEPEGTTVSLDIAGNEQSIKILACRIPTLKDITDRYEGKLEKAKTQQKPSKKEKSEPSLGMN